MTPLGDAIITALFEQGWTIGSHEQAEGFLVALSPHAQVGFGIPVELLHEDELEPMLALLLLHMIQEGGLFWPWPPDRPGTRVEPDA